jgi:hypothetical protein
MKKVHYQNIGYPRTGTTYLYHSLINNKEIFSQTNSKNKFDKLRNKSITSEMSFKENPWQEQNEDLMLVDCSQYISIYEKYDISVNFRPWTFKLSEKHIDKLAEYTSHASLTLRNPYEVLNSNFNMNWSNHLRNLDNLPPSGFFDDWQEYKSKNPDHKGNNLDHVLDFYIYHFEFSSSVKKWLNFKNKFQIFFYDDLVQDKTLFYKSVCDFIGVDYNNPIIKPMNTSDDILTQTNNKDKKSFEFKPNHIEAINYEIDQISNLTGKDLSHWKK